MSSIKKNMGYNILLTISNMIFPIITFPYISRVLGPEGTGVINFSQNFCQYFIMFSALGIPIYGVREIARLRDDVSSRSKAFIEISIIRIISTLIALIPYFILVMQIEKLSRFTEIYYWGAVFILINIFSIEWFFTGLEEFRFITTRTVIVKAISIFFLFVFVKQKDDLLPYFLIIVFTLFINCLINLKYAFNYLSFKLNWNRLEFKRHLKPLLIIFGSSLAMSIYLYLDTMMLGFLSNDKTVGLYSASMRITKLCLSIITSFGQVLVPRLSHAVAVKDSKEMQRLLKKSVTFVLTLGTPLMIGLYILAPELISIFSGKEFLPAVSTMRVLCPLILIIGLAHIFSVQILIPLGKDKQLLIISIIGSLVSVALNYVLIPLLDGSGAAITNIVAEVIVTMLAFLLAKRYINILIPLDELVKNILLTIPYFLIAYLSRLLFVDSIEIVLLTTFCSLVVFFVSQVIILKNQLAMEVLLKFRTSLNFKTTG